MSGMCEACRCDVALPGDDLCAYCRAEAEEEAAYWQRRKLAEQAEHTVTVAEVAG